MSEHFDDPGLRRAEELAFLAEQAERRGDHSDARLAYELAASLDFKGALRITGRPRTRTVVAVEAVCLFARAGRYEKAVEAAERFLAEPDELGPSGVTELQAVLDAYRRPGVGAELMRSNRWLCAVRAQIRAQAQEAA